MSTPGILNCDESMPFWTSWDGGHIKVGRGVVVGQDIFMELLESSSFTIHDVSLTSKVEEAYWFFNDSMREAL